MLTEALWLNCAPVLLPKQARPLSKTTWDPSPKHPSNPPLYLRLYTIRVKSLSSSPCYFNLPVFSRLYPSLVSPEDLEPLLLCPIQVIFCPLLPDSSVSVCQLGLFQGSKPPKTFLFKCCLNSIYLTIPAKDPRDLRPRGPPILCTCTNPIN